ncbi:MAG TPA: hypothetical protein QF753_08755 [Victivallales bacterium]|jgi:hypothetical protein|nr:hypothetical protein [Victivallales bacterium]|tara:strand:- start:56 stop:328 length:273 start_codon:yes stop_codon:yes gene_type:complete
MPSRPKKKNKPDTIKYDEEYDLEEGYDDIGDIFGASDIVGVLLKNSIALTEMVLKYSGKEKIAKEEIFKTYKESVVHAVASMGDVSEHMN